jgi:NitT/TauT family transport system ATP-binding protein
MCQPKQRWRASLSMETQSPLIALKEVSKSYSTKSGEVLAVEKVSLDIEDGQFVSVLGPSGCGKSTLLLMLAGLISRTAGEVTISGQNIKKPYTDLGIVFQEPNLLEWRTVLQNVMMQIEMRHLDSTAYEKKSRELLNMVGLSEVVNRLPHELSGGQRQRAAICRALVHNPPLVLMDEPFGALDALTRDEMNMDLQRLWLDQGKTIVFVTHSITEAVFLSDRVVVMTPRPGRIAADVKIDLPRPRTFSIRETPQFGAYTSRIRRLFEELGVLQREDGDVQHP